MRKDLVLVGLLVTTLALMAIPISQGLIDVLIAVNMSLAVMLLMVAVYVRQPSDFATFPSVILIGTAFRLALSIATTRLILSEADAGAIIETFGDFVVAGSVGIGLVIFLIITVVQFLVITKGAERVAEVGARFTLDALPGKQMTIDAEARAENITAAEAREQRAQLDKDSQFFGAMDGAMKFVKGDSIAGLIIICINLIGGVIVGMSVHGLGFGQSVSVFSLLTIGDGLVAQLPALLMSLCAGVMVTRVKNQDAQDLGSDIAREIVSDVRIPAVGALIVFGMGLIPGFPTLVFSAIAATMLVSAAMMRSRLRREEAEAEAEAGAEAAADDPADATPGTDLPTSDRFILGLGADLSEAIDLDALRTDLERRHDTLYMLRGVRFPATQVDPAMADLDPMEACITLDEVPLMRVTIESGKRLVRSADAKTVDERIGTIETVPFESKVMDGVWVDDALKTKMDEAGIGSTDALTVLSMIAFRLYEHNMGQMFNNDVLRDLLSTLRQADAEMLDQIVEDMKPPALLKTFRYLVEDGVPLRPANLVVSSLHYWISNTDGPTPVIMAEGLRSSMKRQLCHSIAGRAGVLGLALVDPTIEGDMRRGLAEIAETPSDPTYEGLYFEPETHEEVLAQFRKLERDSTDGAYQLTVVASSDVRRRLRNFLAMNDVHLPVLAPHEIAVGVPSFPLQAVTLDGDADRSRAPEAIAAE